MRAGTRLRLDEAGPLAPPFLLERVVRSLLYVSFLGLLCAAPAAAEVVTYQCIFEYRIDADGRADELMPLEFKIDTLNRRAFMEGNVGIVDVEIHVGESAFSFVERVDSGAIQTTTITADGLAVHSRNTVILGEIVAAQHFGRCVPRQ